MYDINCLRISKYTMQFVANNAMNTVILPKSLCPRTSLTTFVYVIKCLLDCILKSFSLENAVVVRI